MDDQALNQLTQRIIGCAIEVHRNLGPGLLESIELDQAGLAHVRQQAMPVTYKGYMIGEHRLDILVEDAVILELKSVERFDPVFEAQILSYLAKAISMQPSSSAVGSSWPSAAGWA